MRDYKQSLKSLKEKSENLSEKTPEITVRLSGTKPKNYKEISKRLFQDLKEATGVDILVEESENYIWGWATCPEELGEDIAELLSSVFNLGTLKVYTEKERAVTDPRGYIIGEVVREVNIKRAGVSTGKDYIEVMLLNPKTLTPEFSRDLIEALREDPEGVVEVVKEPLVSNSSHRGVIVKVLCNQEVSEKVVGKIKKYIFNVLDTLYIERNSDREL